jgi:hypothetical protein
LDALTQVAALTVGT